MQQSNKSQSIIKSSFWSYAGIIVLLFAGLITNIALARLLDKENWGVLSTLIAVVSFLLSVSELGINYYVFYVVSKYADKGKEAVKRHLSGPLRYKLILIFSIAALMFVFSEQLADLFHIQTGAKYFMAGTLYFVFLNIFGVFNGVLAGLKKFKEDSITSSLHYILRLVFAALLVILGFGLDGAIVGYILAIFLATILQIIFLRGFLSISHKNSDGLYEMFSYGFYFGIVSIAATFSLWADSVMVGIFIGSTAVGIYKIAVSLSTASAGLLNGISKVMFPYFTSEESKGKDSIKYLNAALKYSLFFTIPALFGIVLSAESIVNVFFGQQYSDASIPLLILSYLVFDGVIIGLISSYLAAKKSTKILGTSSLISAIFNIVLNFISIPILGIVGAAITSVASRIINLMLLLHWSKTKLGRTYEFPFILPLLGSLAMATVLFLLNPIIAPTSSVINLFIFIAVGILVYLVSEQLLGFDVIGFGKKITKTLVPEKFLRHLPMHELLE